MTAVCGPQTLTESAWVLGYGAGVGNQGVSILTTPQARSAQPHVGQIAGAFYAWIGPGH